MKKSRAGWPVAISVVLLLGVVGLTDSAEFLPRSLLFVCGALVAVIGLVWALAAKSGRAVPVLGCVLLAAYGLTSSFCSIRRPWEALLLPQVRWRWWS